MGTNENPSSLKNMSDTGKKKIVIIGDGYVGKTCVLHAIMHGEFSEQAPNVFEEFAIEKQFNNKKVILQFVDTPGQEEYDALRKLMYTNVDIFLICFSIADVISFENAKTKWIADIKQYNNIPKILVGTKLDLRINNKNLVRKEDIKNFQKRIRAVSYIECSSKSREGINELIDCVMFTALGDTKRSCVLQ